MTDLNELLTNQTLDEIISPEGVVEKLVEKNLFYITQTEGGKFRIYHNDSPMQVCDTLEDADKSQAIFMTLVGSLELNPKETTEFLMRGTSKKKPDSDT